MFELCAETQECRLTWKQTIQARALSLQTSGLARLDRLSQEVAVDTICHVEDDHDDGDDHGDDHDENVDRHQDQRSCQGGWHNLSAD